MGKVACDVCDWGGWGGDGAETHGSQPTNMPLHPIPLPASPLTGEEKIAIPQSTLPPLQGEGWGGDGGGPPPIRR